MDKERVLVELSDCVEILEDIDSAEYTKAELAGLHGSVLSAIMDAQEFMRAQAKVKTKCNTGLTQWYVCTGCDASVNPGDRFCRMCGKVLVWDEQEKQNKRADMMYREYVGT